MSKKRHCRLAALVGSGDGGVEKWRQTSYDLTTRYGTSAVSVPADKGVSEQTLRLVRGELEYEYKIDGKLYDLYRFKRIQGTRP